jgi:hypothetical protein
VAATLAAHSRHLIWVMMAYGLGRRVVLARSLRAERLASEVLSFRSLTVCRTPRCRHHWDSSATERARCRTKTRYGDPVDVQRAADLYAQGWTLRQIGAELDVTETTVSESATSCWGIIGSPDTPVTARMMPP